MAKDNNNINTDELTAGVNAGTTTNGGSSGGKGLPTGSESGDGPADGGEHTTPAEVPRREENPFSFKHFLKRDCSLSSAGQTSTTAGLGSGTGNGTSSINHSRSTSNINGNGNEIHATGSSTGSGHGSGVASNNNTCTLAGSGSPSKSATTSSLHASSTTGAKPKIPQFQSVNTLTSESKMKRSPRFPSFDSQSSLSDLADDKYMANLYHSRSNSSFYSDPPLTLSGAAGTLGGNAGSGSSNGAGMQQFVQRSYSHYDMDSPGSGPEQRGRSRESLNSGNPGGTGGHHRIVGSSEFSAALPDFVQDHLVMEQWYNTLTGSPKNVTGGGGAGGSGSPASVDFDHLPDFAVSNNPDTPSLLVDMPFDLTASNRNRGPTPARNSSPNVPLDLPASASEFAFDLPRRRITPPPDLPPDLTENNASGCIGAAGGAAASGAGAGYYYAGSPPSAGSAADKIQRLPDFLSDGPIHSSGRLADVTHDTPHFNSPDADTMSQQRLQAERMENDRLRREIDGNRRIMTEQARRIGELERELAATATSPAKVSTEPSGLGEASSSSSLLYANTRAATAEAQVEKLRQKIYRLNVEIESLRRENETLKEEGAVGGTGAGTSGEGACGGIGTGGGTRAGGSRELEISRELRQAATSAENNLRQLLTGVGNLRMIARTLEYEYADRNNIIPIEVFLSDTDDDELLGPAL